MTRVTDPHLHALYVCGQAWRCDLRGVLLVGLGERKCVSMSGFIYKRRKMLGHIKAVTSLRFIECVCGAASPSRKTAANDALLEKPYCTGGGQNCQRRTHAA